MLKTNHRSSTDIPNFAYRLIETVAAMNHGELHITFISDMTYMHPALNKTIFRRIVVWQLQYEGKRFFLIKFYMYFLFSSSETIKKSVQSSYILRNCIHLSNIFIGTSILN
jgi:hypothetical protein